MARSRIFAVVAASLLVAFVFACRRGEAPPSASTAAGSSRTTDSAQPALDRDEEAVAAVVRTFGERLKQVSVLGPPDVVQSEIRRQYTDLATPALLAEWLRDPALAPGRQVSSPYPDRIEIDRVDVDRDRANVRGAIVEVTVQEEVARIPVDLRLARHDGTWRIASFESRRPHESEPPPPAAAEDQPTDALAVLLEYYASIDRSDYERAFEAWGSSGPPGQTLDEFRKGFSDTTRVHVQAGTPSQLGAAAGSRYVEIPVTVVAFTKSGKEQRFQGTYTMRRTVVDGAPEADRVWHIDRATLRQAK